ncbi:MAG TPA: tetratricopeptide repeat protein [Thermoanaerobaculia bacterium]|nr:tetratricopeptide repeat protein [Thermoanaerobaculia bacterium]
MIPQTLQDRLRRGQVIPFVGAGVSRAVLRSADGEPLFPGWRDLLIRAADRLGRENRTPESGVVRNLLDIGSEKYLEAARYAREGLGPLWPSFLKEEIDRSSEDANPESLSLARAVWGLGHPLVITTNYDKVLHWSCPDLKNLDLWDIEAKAEQGRLLRDDGRPARPTVWHLHGRIGNAADLILTPDGYSRLYQGESEGRYKAALATFRTLLASRSLLFVGFSFDDRALGVELRGVNDLFEGTSGPHYAVVRAGDVERLRALNLPLVFVTFPSFGEPLVSLVTQLGNIARDGAGALPGPSPSSPDTAPLPPGASYSPDNRPFFVPFRPKGERVIGRDQALQRVRDQLTSGKPTNIGQTAAFQGLGGLGKTQLAVEYAWRYKDEYPNGVIWLTADQDIAAQLTRLAVEARWVAGESEHRVKLDVAQHRLRSFSDCLIIFDNLEDRAAIEPYLPLPSANPHLLVTSRAEQPGFVPIPLDFLDEEESVALLTLEAGRSATSEAEKNAAREIARELGGLPLALEMAGAYLLHRSVPWQQYRSLLQSNPRAALHPRLLASFTRHEADLFATLRVQEGLLAEEPLLGEILDLLTWSGSATMGLSLLAALLSVGETELVGALALGAQLRLLERTATADRYGLHRLVRKVRQEDRPLKERAAWAEEVCRRLGDWFFARRQDFVDLPAFEAEIDHLDTWREQASSLGSPHASRLIWLLAYPPFHRGQFKISLRWVEQALALFQSDGNQDRELEAWIWSDLGVVNGMEGLYKESLEVAQRALSIRQEVLGDDHADTALSLGNLATTYNSLGDWNKALDFSFQALSIQRKILGEEHPHTARSYSAIGVAYSGRGDSKEALNYELRSFATLKTTLGEQHPHTASACDSVGVCYGNLGDWKKALEFSLEALQVNRKILGELHPATGKSLQNVGWAYAGYGRLKEALEYGLEALKIHREILSEHHPTIAASLANLGWIQSRLGQWNKALDLYIQALEIQRKSLGAKHPETAMALQRVAFVYRQLGKPELGLDHARQALEIQREILGSRHPHTVESVLNVAGALKELDQRVEAFNLTASLLQDLPSNPDQARRIKTLAQQLKSKPLRPGFRQPPKRGKRKRR